MLRRAVAARAVAVPESFAHRLESAPRPDLPLLALLRSLSGGLRLPDEPGAVEVGTERRLARTVARETGATTAVLDPIEGLTPSEQGRGDTYFTVMRRNLAALRKALACR